MSKNGGLDARVVQAICSVLQRYPQVSRAVLYGSRAKGTHANGSDIDLCLYGDETLGIQILHRILGELDDLLLPYSFDVQIYSDIQSEALLDHIRRVGKTLYARHDTSSAKP